MKKYYQAPKSANVVLFTPITMQQFGIGVGSPVNGLDLDPIETE